MPRRNLNPTHNRTAAAVDSLGNVRVYFDVDRNLSAGLTMMAAKHHLTKREMLVQIMRDALAKDVEIAKIVGVTPR
jgi:hypothetical protein